MSILMNLLVVLQVLAALAMVGLILMQHGKGADMGAAFGSGASGSLFGASGSANFLSRSTAVLATVFFACTLALAYFGNNLSASRPSGSVLDQHAAAVAPAASAPSSASAPAAVSSAVAAIPASVGVNAAPASAATSAPQAPASGAARIPQ